MSGGAHWIGPRLFMGRTMIGQVEPSKEPGKWLGMSYLPGAPSVIGRDFTSDAEARARVLASAQSRCKAMFGAGLQTTADAVSEGRGLRVVARAIWRAGVWRCDRPVNAHALFTDLGRALGLKAEDAPRAAKADQGGGSSAEPSPEPEDFDPIERERTPA